MFREGTSWFGTCWYIHEHEKYEFKVEFDIPVSYPLSGPEIALPELDGKTAKMYRGGKICLERIFATNCKLVSFSSIFRNSVKRRTILNHCGQRTSRNLVLPMQWLSAWDHGLLLRFQTWFQRA